LLLFTFLQQIHPLRDFLLSLRQDRRDPQNQPAHSPGHEQASAESVPVGFRKKKSFHKMQTKLEHENELYRLEHVASTEYSEIGRTKTWMPLHGWKEQSSWTSIGRQKMRALLWLEMASLFAGTVPMCVRPAIFLYRRCDCL
jgi:hypothetical protein